MQFGQLLTPTHKAANDAAILGRYLNWLFYFGEDWLKATLS